MNPNNNSPVERDSTAMRTFDDESVPYLKLCAAKIFIHIQDYVEYRAKVVKRKSDPFSRKNRVKDKDGISAKYWLLNDSSLEPFSFIWCCEMLDINPKSVRERCQSKWLLILRNMKPDNKFYMKYFLELELDHE